MQTKLTRRLFISAAGALTATSAVSAAFADEAQQPPLLSPDLMDRVTLYGLENDSFDPAADVSDEIVDRICTAALSAPSAFGSTALQLVVVRDREAMELLHGANPDANQLDTCPVCIVILEHAAAEDAHSNFFQFDAGLAAMAALAQATREGLATAVAECPAQDANTGEYIDYSFIGCDGERYVPQLVVALGRPAVDATTSASVKQDVEARVWQGMVDDPGEPEPQPQFVVFTLPANSGTGYEWTAESTDEAVLALVFTDILDDKGKSLAEAEEAPAEEPPAEEAAAEEAPAEGDNALGAEENSEETEEAPAEEAPIIGGMTGAKVNYVFSFEAIEPGEAEVYVNLARPWEESDDDVSIACSFTVNDDLSITLDYYNGPDEYKDSFVIEY